MQQARLSELSMFLPVYNEKDHLEGLVRRSLEVLPDVAERFEIIIVDDGSRDGSAQIADTLARQHPEVRVVHHEKNQGYGGAVRSGIQASRYKFIFFTDGDAQFDIGEIKALTPYIQEHDIVAGYRQKRQDHFLRKVYSFGWTTLTNLLLRMRIRDMDCAFKLFRAPAVKSLELHSRGNMISAEMLTLASRNGCKIYQLPVRHLPRTSGKAKGVNFGVVTRAFRELMEFYTRTKSGHTTSGGQHAQSTSNR